MIDPLTPSIAPTTSRRGHGPSPRPVTTETVACNLCGSAKRSVLAQFVMYAPLSLVKCSRCGLLYVSPRLTHESLAVHFNENYLHPSDALAWERSRDEIYRQILDLVTCRTKREIFEIGCSYGTFLSRAQAAGLTVAGCDISAEACRRASDRLGIEIFNGAFEQLEDVVPPQDCIVSIDTLYYCPDPQHHLSVVYNKLKRGGILVLRVRNGLHIEWTARLGLGSCPIEHIYFFTPHTLGTLLRKAGFVRSHTVAGVCHGLPRPIERVMRSASRALASGLGTRYLLSKDFCMVAVKN
jgi:SAM-dependent methyltransferase